MNFNNIYTHGIARVGAATFEVTLGDPQVNAGKIIELARAAATAHVAVLVFPRDCLAGATVGDWGGNTSVTTATGAALRQIAQETKDLGLLLVLGARLAGQSRALFITDGTVHDAAESPLGFTASNLAGLRVLPLVGEDLLGSYAALATRVSTSGFGSILPDKPASSESDMAAGTPLPAAPTLLVQLAAPVRTVGALRRLHRAARELSRSTGTAVVVAAGSRGESSTDSTPLAAGFVSCNGSVLAAEEHLGTAGLTLADVVLPELLATRGDTAWDYPFGGNSENFRVDVDLDAKIPLLEPPAQRPLVPGSARRYRAELREAFEVQVAGLMRRLSAVRDANIVLGLSGGLDSTLALLVAVAAKAGRFESQTGREAGESPVAGLAPHENETIPAKTSPTPVTSASPANLKLATNGNATDQTANTPDNWRRAILAFTMPGFATSAGTKNAALRLAEALGVDCETIDIRATATEMLRTMGHPAGSGEPVYDVTFENIQAGLRADYLFRLANQRGGFVLGTGDLSEAALGWCTYGVGDHMSHYGVNGGVPKSMMPDLIRVAARVLCERGLVGDEARLHEVLAEVISADITPELIPDHADAGGVEQHQTTEGAIGPYLLHDFFLYHTLRGANPRLVAFLAVAAFTRQAAGGDAAGALPASPTGGSASPTDENHPVNSEVNRYFSREEILEWLRVFYRRFLTQQFKRTAMVAGPVIWEGMSLSPRTGFHFPADLSPETALAELGDL